MELNMFLIQALVILWVAASMFALGYIFRAIQQVQVPDLVSRPVDQPAPRAVRVRIAVAVNHKGEWSAAGDNCWQDEMAEHECRRCMGGETVHWIEAAVPLPESQTIEGMVTDGD